MRVTKAIVQHALEFGNPVTNGRTATFIWEGSIAPHLISEVSGWENRPKPFRRLSRSITTEAGEPAWSCSLTLPRDAYLEYAFYDSETEQKISDPLNTRSVSNGVGGRNHFFYMPGAEPSPLVKRRRNVPAGSVDRYRVGTRWLRDEHERTVYLYKPPVKEPVPLLVVYDGQDYLRRGKLNVIVDNLIAQKRIQPIAIAFLPHAGKWRNIEYASADGTLMWLDETILPLARKRLKLLNVRKHRGVYGVLGASLGGTMSMYTGLRMPEVFGRVLSQAGAFSIMPVDFAAVDLVRLGQARDIRIWMDVGKLDELLKDNRGMQALLKKKGYEVIYREYSGGHNYTAWRDNISHGLEAMFPP